jgi:hypothetical protein
MSDGFADLKRLALDFLAFAG